jgi:hypothetical protein
MSNDKTEPVVDATPAEKQLASLEPDEIESVDLIQVTGGVAPIDDKPTIGGRCG